MFREVERVLIRREEIERRVGEIADALGASLLAELHEDGVEPDDARIVLVPVMTGALVFAADLIRRLPLKLRLELVAVSSYAGATTVSRGALLAGEMPSDLRGARVVVVDDIVDSGRTLDLLTTLLRERGPRSVRTVVLLDKATRRAVEFAPDHVGFEIPDEFVVGYGLDFDGYYRNLPDIATLRPEAVRGPLAEDPSQ